MQYVMLLGLTISSLIMIALVAQPKRTTFRQSLFGYTPALLLSFFLINGDYGFVSNLALIMTIANIIFVLGVSNSYKTMWVDGVKENAKLGVFSRIMIFNMGETANDILRSEGSESRVVLRDGDNTPVNIRDEYTNYISVLDKEAQIEAVEMAKFASEEEKKEIIQKYILQNEENVENVNNEDDILDYVKKSISDKDEDDNQEEAFISSLGNNRNYDEDMSKFK